MNDTILEAAKRLKFIFAKSMPNIPHYYTVKDNNNKKDYERLFLHILNNGYDKKFFKKGDSQMLKTVV